MQGQRLFFLFVCFLSFHSLVYSSVLTEIKISDGKKAEIRFLGIKSSPEVVLKSNLLELTFKDTELDPIFEGKLDLASSHPLIKRVSAFQLDAHSVKAHLILNGTTEGLKERLHFSSDKKGGVLEVDYPKANGKEVSEFLPEEEIPLLGGEKLKEGKPSEKWGVTFTVMVGALLLLMGGLFYFVKGLKNKGIGKGTRKYLIEQMSFCNLGPKMGVSLLKIGREFVLVGVTPHQISLLSPLNQLKEQYDQENQFERSTFNEAIKEELKRLQS